MSEIEDLQAKVLKYSNLIKGVRQYISASEELAQKAMKSESERARHINFGRLSAFHEIANYIKLPQKEWK